MLLAVTILAGSFVFSRGGDPAALAAGEVPPGESLRAPEEERSSESAIVSIKENDGEEAVLPEEAGDPAEAEDPTEPEGPVEAEDPAEPEDPTEAVDPADSEDPAEAEDPAQPEDPVEAEDPAQSEAPMEAEDPNGTEETEPADEPTDAEDPAGPEETTPPEENETAGPEESGEAEPGQGDTPAPEQPSEPEDPKAAILVEREPLLPAHVATGVFQDAAGVAVSYTWGEPVPETTPTDDGWFSDAVFVGNSLFDGLWLYGNIKGGSFLSAKSISVNNIMKEAPINKGGVYLTIPEALSLKQYRKVYVMLGVNELILAPASYYESYASLIDTIRELQPGAEIYIQSITPVTRETSETNVYVNQANILAFNEQLRLLSADKQVYYINIHDALMDEEGFLPDDKAFDGIHLLRSYYEKWCDYLRCHTITEVNQ